jgi:pimeloyl-ACP methyl ester carboxylesterase
MLDGKPMAPCPTTNLAALCGNLIVAENPDDPSGRTIPIHVMVIPARSPQPAPDPIFFLAGGPGGSATESFGWTTSTFSRLNAERDFVLVDQRGTGGSNRMVAPEPPDVAGLDETGRDVAIREWVDRVLAELPGDPRFYTTSLAMDDVDVVRAALGYDEINLYGPSYGATAAQYYLRQHEEHVRAVVLDGGTLLDVPIFEWMAVSSQKALDILLARCADDEACAAAYPEVATEFATIETRLAVAPITTKVIDPYSGEPIVLDSLSFASAVHGALVETSLSSKLPALIHQAYLGHWDAVAEAGVAASGGRRPNDDQLVMATVIRCSEAWARYDPAEVERLGAGTYGLAVHVAAAQAQRETCRYVPAGVIPLDDGSPVRSNVPVLLLVGEADPQDPPANVADAPEELPNSRTVVVPGAGHTVGHLACMPSIVADFIDAGTAKGLDVSCAATDVPLPPFLILPD